MRQFAIGVLLLISLASSGLPAWAADNTATATCTFEDGKQVSVRYAREPGKTKDAPRNGKLWTPGNQPLLLFTQAGLSAGNSDLPVGAYSMYIIPGKESWTLIVSKNVSSPAKYDDNQDIVRMTMPMGELSEPQKKPSIVFGQMGPKRCNMRVYYGTTGTWATFEEK